MKHKLVLSFSIFIFTLSTVSTVRGQWVETNGPYGVWSTFLAVADSTVFAGNTSLDPIASLTGSSKTWKSTKFPLPFNRYVMAITAIGSKLLVGLDSGYTGNVGNSIYASTDGGVNWEWSSTGLTDNTVNCFTVNDSFVFAGTYESGVFRSSDSGATWVPADSDIDFQYVISLVTIPGYILAGTEFGQIFRSSNNGVSWTEVDSTLPFHYEALTAMLFGDSGIKVFASISSEGIFSSTDLGASWRPANNGLTDSNVNKITRCGAKLVAATNGGIFLSSDDGNSWVSSNKGLFNTIVSDVIIRDTSLFILTTNGIFCSIDSGQSWVEFDTGLTSVLQTSVLLKDGENLFAGTSLGIYLSTDTGFSWVQRNRGLSDVGITALNVIHSSAGPIIFAGTASGPFRSTDYGDSWSLVDSGFPNFPSNDPEVLSFATIDTFLYAASWYGDLVRSTNYGTTWKILSTPMTSLFLNLTSNGSYLFAGGIFNLESCVFLSKDQGRSWDILNQFSNNDYGVNALAIDTDSIGTTRFYVDAYGDEYGGVVVSTDLGGTWQSLNWGLDSLDKVSISWFDNNGSFLLCGCPHGFYFSSYKRDFWTKFNQGLHDSDVYTIASTNSNIFIGTDSGVWRRPVSEMIAASSVSEKLPPQTEAFVYPNPFSQSTQITFTSQAAGYAEVSIVNMLGVEVARLFSGELGAGEHSFTWDAGKNAYAKQGVYECLIRMNGQVETLPVVLMR